MCVGGGAPGEPTARQQLIHYRPQTAVGYSSHGISSAETDSGSKQKAGHVQRETRRGNGRKKRQRRRHRESASSLSVLGRRSLTAPSWRRRWSSRCPRATGDSSARHAAAPARSCWERPGAAPGGCSPHAWLHVAWAWRASATERLRLAAPASEIAAVQLQLLICNIPRLLDPSSWPGSPVCSTPALCPTRGRLCCRPWRRGCHLAGRLRLFQLVPAFLQRIRMQKTRGKNIEAVCRQVPPGRQGCARGRGPDCLLGATHAGTLPPLLPSLRTCSCSLATASR